MVARTVCEYVNLVLSMEDLRLEGEEGGPQAQAPVVFTQLFTKAMNHL